jgi:hypothetical protein
MDVTVSLKIELDATASLNQMERQIGEAGRAAMKEALEQALHQNEEQQKRCPECGSDQVQTQGTKRRVSASQFRTGGNASQAAALSAVFSPVSPSRALFGRSSRTHRDAALTRTRRASRQFVAG